MKRLGFNYKEGLLDDGVPRRSALQLERVEQLFREKYKVADVIFRRKPLLSRVSPKELLQELADKADFVVAAIGV